MNTSAKWTKITCRCTAKSIDAESIASWAVELGAKGAHNLEDNMIEVFVEDPKLIPAISQGLEEIGAEILSRLEVKNENWVKNCQDVWSPVKVKEITLSPSLDGSSSTNNPDEILILPGNGFGTGHHESTRLALSLLQHENVLSNPPHTVLDVGTGNAVLALAAALLFNCKIVAIDNDELAIENASQNLELNPRLRKLIDLKLGELSDKEDKVDLLLANIYAHTLCHLENEFYSHLETNGILILSGIMKSQSEDIINAFSSRQSAKTRWTFIHHEEENNWISFMLKKNPA